MAGTNSTTATDERDDGPPPGGPHGEYEDKFSDYYEQALPEPERRAMAEHLGGCEACREAFDHFKSAVTALSGLHDMAAPPELQDSVARTIHRRSGGRFFGRRAFGDRVPFEVLAVVVLILGLIVFALLRSSSTGSLRYDREDTQAPEIAPGARDVVPQPAQPGR